MKKYHGESKMSSGRAGLPAEVKMKDYPKCDYGMGGYNDSREGIDMLAKSNIKQAKKNPGGRGPVGK
tara:strand:- start:221 stop:421 length:201 start_codon:yes stop_codon:yes gene_type:complete